MADFDNLCFFKAGSPGYGSDYDEEPRFTPNGPATSAQRPYHSPDSELLKQQLIDHHRDSPRPPFSQPQMVQGMMGLTMYCKFSTEGLFKHFTFQARLGGGGGWLNSREGAYLIQRR